MCPVDLTRMSGPAAERTQPTKTVLAVADQAFLIAAPLLVVNIAIFRPAIVGLWALIALASMLVIGGFALLGRAGRAPWRGAVYSIVTLAVAIGALWAMGPITGIGALFGLSISCAAAFLRWRALLVVIAIAGFAVVVRTFVGGAFGMHPVIEGQFALSLSVWLSTGIASLIILSVVWRLLRALFAWLEESYVRSADAYAREAATRRDLERKRQQLEELARVELVGRLAGGVAHDMNNALAAILAAADVLAADVTTPDERRQLAELESASHYAADLVRDLLWIGRRFPMSTTATANLEAVVRKCIERAGRVSREIVIELQIGHRVVLAMSPEHLEQIVFGLVIGAERAGVTRLALATAAVDASERVAIVFESREAGAPATGSRAMQTQLAISAARELVGQYAGALASLGDDHFGRITIDLPIVSGQRVTANIPVPVMRTALVVEDEPMVLRRLCQLVARRGYEVSSATTVAEGMARLADDPDLLITDLQLPDGSGEEIALASFAGNPLRPIVVCSGFSADDVRRGRLRDAPLTFLAKPFTTADFEAAIP